MEEVCYHLHFIAEVPYVELRLNILAGADFASYFLNGESVESGQPVPIQDECAA